MPRSWPAYAGLSPPSDRAPHPGSAGDAEVDRARDVLARLRTGSVSVRGLAEASWVPAAALVHTKPCNRSQRVSINLHKTAPGARSGSNGRGWREPKDEQRKQPTGEQCKCLQMGCKNYRLDSFGHLARMDLNLSTNENHLGSASPFIDQQLADSTVTKNRGRPRSKLTNY
jgi:hypothetical protein